MAASIKPKSMQMLPFHHYMAPDRSGGFRRPNMVSGSGPAGTGAYVCGSPVPAGFQQGLSPREITPLARWLRHASQIGTMVRSYHVVARAAGGAGRNPGLIGAR